MRGVSPKHPIAQIVVGPKRFTSHRPAEDVAWQISKARWQRGQNRHLDTLLLQRQREIVSRGLGATHAMRWVGVIGDEEDLQSAGFVRATVLPIQVSKTFANRCIAIGLTTRGAPARVKK